jgi:hypothetical protein
MESHYEKVAVNSGINLAVKSRTNLSLRLVIDLEETWRSYEDEFKKLRKN